MRTTRDSMGEMAVPDEALWGASTARAVSNFPISGRPLPPAFIRALGLVKWAAARANEELGKLPPHKSRLIQQAAREIAEGQHVEHFPVDLFQSGSGTSTNMNANEVIAGRAAQLGDAANPSVRLHPNDDVNLSQSSNDVMPTALHVSVAQAMHAQLCPALADLAAALEAKSAEFADVVKIGRTHLMDAIPMTLGQEFSGYATQLRKAEERVQRAAALLCELAIGGTAVGTGVNAPPSFGAHVCAWLAEQTGLPFREARNHFEAQAARDDCVEAAGQLATVAVSLTKVANDIRLLGSGPLAGLAEISLPATQPGSSIMPGKVNPVMCEVVVQVGLYVQGLTQIVVACGRDGHLELNATVPLIAHCLHESIRCLANAARAFTSRCVLGIEADRDRCRDFAERSPMLVTALAPTLGYDAAAEIAKAAMESRRAVRDLVLERGVLDEATVDQLLDPLALTGIAPPQATPRGRAEQVWEDEGGRVPGA